MEIAKARTLSEQELVDELATARRHLYDLRFQLATRQLTDYSQISQTRRDIARLLTVQTERASRQGRRRRPRPARRREVDERRDSTRARQAQDQGRPGRVRQDGQDDRRLRRAPGAPPHLQARHPPDHQVQGPRRAQRGAHRRHRAHRGVAAPVGHEALAPRRDRGPRRRGRRPGASWPRSPRRPRPSTWPPIPGREAAAAEPARRPRPRRPAA